MSNRRSLIFASFNSQPFQSQASNIKAAFSLHSLIETVK